MQYPHGDEIIDVARTKAKRATDRAFWAETDLSDDHNAFLDTLEIVEYAGSDTFQNFILEGITEIHFDVPELSLLFAYYDVDSPQQLVGKQLPVIVDKNGNFRIFACQGSKESTEQHALVFVYDDEFATEHKEMIRGGIEEQ